MSIDISERSALQLRSLVKSSGELELSLAEVPVRPPAPDEVLVRIDASPLNPSDLGLLFAGADLGSARTVGGPDRPVLTARIPESTMKTLARRIDLSASVGNEGAGVVVETGSSTAAKALLGKTVALMGGAMYAQYRHIAADQVLLLPEGATPADGASCFINPLTALGMVDTMRREGHSALVHTAAASNLGQMLNRICLKDGIALVNIVRKQEQADLMKSMGAQCVCVTSSPSFLFDLTEALAATGATIAFDATGGGKLPGQILRCMEDAISRKITEYNRYGSSTLKQVYIYGSLESGPTEFERNFGSAWSMGGWLLFSYLQKIGPAAAQALKQRVAAELKTTFTTHYAKEISLAEVLHLDMISRYHLRATGEKFLINPAKNAAQIELPAR